jgi:hypothetical protein
MFAILIIEVIMAFASIGVCAIDEEHDPDFFCVFIPFYFLFKYPYSLIKFIIKKIDEHRQQNIKNEQYKVQQEQEKYKDLYEQVYKISCEFWESAKSLSMNPSIHKDIYNLLRFIKTNYSIIINNKYSLDLAYNRLLYLLTFIEECKKNNMMNEPEILEEIKSMSESVDNLFKELVQSINDMNTQANNQLKEYLKSKAKEFVSISDEMVKDFKNLNNKK